MKRPLGCMIPWPWSWHRYGAWHSVSFNRISRRCLYCGYTQSRKKGKW